MNTDKSLNTLAGREAPEISEIQLNEIKAMYNVNEIGQLPTD